MTDGSMPTAIPELKSKIEPFYTRIRKSHLSLPDAEEKRVAVPMSSDHERIYPSLQNRTVPHLKQPLKDPSAMPSVRPRLLTLLQLSVNPILLLSPPSSHRIVLSPAGHA